ncbi:alkaline phosphatase PhoX [Rivularia sp. UHCC 0363]|uniref:alkaline phosphatase PhoX n=1 Tax=Rivularia sp. UHCC 0363 TaxID=3110244 RepID=UPI002B1F8104|nr:alkaline phosphatase PhoX [Rivularia sp. UHCC 0363]MEA5597421.1 alkaline phosphatase PhoX [Rivularia sp. UHCC 0363]
MAAFDTTEQAQVKGLNGYQVDPIVTIGETIDDYTPPGVPDGLGAYKLTEDTVRVLANHELQPDKGYEYTLKNGTKLTGARVSYFDIDKNSLKVVDAGLAYDTIINRKGEVVDEASDLEFEGINRLCSAHYINAHQFGNGIGLEDSMFFTGEETAGGTEFVVDTATNTMYAVPWMGRAAWENVTELNTGNTDKVALLVGDDRAGAPLLMYVGTKDTSDDAGFLERNGLANGKLYVWVADDTSINEPGEFNGTGNSLDGKFVEIDYYRPDLAGTTEDIDGDAATEPELAYDELGFATQAKQDALAAEVSNFQFSRPEDVATNPKDGTQAVLASTGRGELFAEDDWGTTYKVDVDFNNIDVSDITAKLDILYDGDDAGAGQFADPDNGLRSPDNLDWADDGFIYVQEDRSTQNDTFGGVSGEETSIWRLNPNDGELVRVAQVDRNAVPDSQTDSEPNDLGNWETSGILDVSELFDKQAGELLLFDVQAHSIEGGEIEAQDLVQGGQIAFLMAPGKSNLPVAGTDGDDLVLNNGSNFNGINEIIFTGAGNDEIDLAFAANALTGNNRIDAGSGDDTIYLSKGDRALGGAGDDKFFVGSGGDNILFGGAGADQFWIVSGEIAESANTIVDFEVGSDVIGILGSAGLGIGANTLKLTEMDGNTEVAFGDNTLAMLNGVTGLDINTSVVFA